jgi:putative nucleotidyltransferase with HDIG domain
MADSIRNLLNQSQRRRTLLAASASGPTDEGLAEGLAREFGAPVGLLDPMMSGWRVVVGTTTAALPQTEEVLMTLRGSGVFGAGRVHLWRAERAGGPVWLAVPVAGSGPSERVALAGFAASAGGEQAPWGPVVPEPALRAWGQAVADRLRAEADARLDPTTAFRPGGREPPLFDRLTQRLRVSDPPESFQRLAVTALRETLGVAAVAWVPSPRREPVIEAGTVPGLDAEAYRNLLAVVPGDTVRIANRPLAEHAPGVRRVAAVAAGAETPRGWLFAVNPLDDRAFALAEIELLQPVASLIASQRHNARLYTDLKDLLFGVIRALTSAIDAKDPYTSGHSERVARIAVRLAEELGLAPSQRSDLYLMGLLHDVGKIGIEDQVLKKTGRLTPEEYCQIQAHVRIGVHILSDLKKLQHVLPAVAHHHENLDGSGYPTGLAGEAIPLEARIIAVADAYDAMSSTRPYRERLSPQQIEDNFRKGAGTQWDPKIVAALFAARRDLERIRQRGLGESLQQAVNVTLGRS